jgi:hypothetical protein
MNNSVASALAGIISSGDEVALEGARLVVQTHDDCLDPDVSVAYFLRLQHLQDFRLSRRARGISGNHGPRLVVSAGEPPLRRNPI